MQEVVEQAVAVMGQHRNPICFPAAFHSRQHPVRRVIVPLVLVHDLVCPGNHCLHAERLLPAPGITHSNMLLGFMDCRMQVRYLGPERLLLNVREYRHKFISAGPVDPGGVQLIPDQLITVPDQQITCVMSHRIIDLLEAGNIAVYHAHGLALVRKGIVLKERIAVVSAGERVMEAECIQMLEQIPAPQQRDHKIADHLEQRSDQPHHIRVRIVHAEKAHQLAIRKDRSGSQPLNLLRLEHCIGSGILGPDLLQIPDHHQFILLKEVDPPTDERNRKVLQDLLLRRRRRIAPFIGIVG